MSRRLLLLGSCAALLAAGCGGGDDVADTGADATTGSADVTASDDIATQPIVTVPPGTCEDVPDVANYPDGQLPPVIPPCAIPDELTVHPIRAGIGREAQAGDHIVIDYTGMRSDDGAVFDSSYPREVPFDFTLGRGAVISGWDQGLIGAQAGSMLRLDIPAQLAYGDEPPAGDVIRAGDALSFLVEVRAVVAPVTAADAPLDLRLEPSIDATGVTTEDLRVGDGSIVGAGDTAIAHLLLVRGDNQVVLFDTWERAEPVQIVMSEGGSLPGVIEGLEGASVGTLRVIRMPPDLAFGPEGDASLGLPAGTDLIVVAEVVGVY